ncbi:MAG: hypothetical protein KAJ54_01095 [Candidatus Aenigmarchaeota archaeon]|nr:hypothetical protein [Candidatus Aenigmarchaeota archaeon]MCK5321782.1 hypothetical protein [Candidatus Aenigmarchaeota archaeon]
MEKNKQILALFTTAGILHGVAAQQIVASQNGGTLMLSSVALVLYGLITISNRFIEQRDTKKLFGPGIWPYLTVLLISWIISMNL